VLDIADDPRERRRRKPWKYVIVDSAIIAAIALAAALPETRLPGVEELYAALRAFLYAFFLQLAVERGLKRGGGGSG